MPFLGSHTNHDSPAPRVMPTDLPTEVLDTISQDLTQLQFEKKTPACLLFSSRAEHAR